MARVFVHLSDRSCPCCRVSRRTRRSPISLTLEGFLLAGTEPIWLVASTSTYSTVGPAQLRDHAAHNANVMDIGSWAASRTRKDPLPPPPQQLLKSMSDPDLAV